MRARAGHASRVRRSSRQKGAAMPLASVQSVVHVHDEGLRVPRDSHEFAAVEVGDLVLDLTKACVEKGVEAVDVGVAEARLMGGNGGHLLLLSGWSLAVTALSRRKPTNHWADFRTTPRLGGTMDKSVTPDRGASNSTTLPYLGFTICRRLRCLPRGSGSG